MHKKCIAISKQPYRGVPKPFLEEALVLLTRRNSQRYSFFSTERGCSNWGKPHFLVLFVTSLLAAQKPPGEESSTGKYMAPVSFFPPVM